MGGICAWDRRHEIIGRPYREIGSAARQTDCQEHCALPIIARLLKAPGSSSFFFLQSQIIKQKLCFEPETWLFCFRSTRSGKESQRLKPNTFGNQAV
jgi:hypothetical protein